MITGRSRVRALAVLATASSLAAVGLAVRLRSQTPCRCAPSKFEGGTFHGEYYEDYVLASVLDGVASGTYIDVGANHPFEYNVTALFYERGWHGITIEPNPDFVPLYAKLRPRDVHVNVGIASAGGTMTFYKVTDPPGGDGTYAEGGLSTFDPADARRWRREGLTVSESTVPVTTLNEVLRQRPSRRSRSSASTWRASRSRCSRASTCESTGRWSSWSRPVSRAPRPRATGPGRGCCCRPATRRRCPTGSTATTCRGTGRTCWESSSTPTCA
jgi:FkbM family methyltransferase